MEQLKSKIREKEKNIYSVTSYYTNDSYILYITGILPLTKDRMHLAISFPTIEESICFSSIVNNFKSIEIFRKNKEYELAVLSQKYQLTWVITKSNTNIKNNTENQITSILSNIYATFLLFSHNEWDQMKQNIQESHNFYDFKRDCIELESLICNSKQRTKEL